MANNDGIEKLLEKCMSKDDDVKKCLSRSCADHPNGLVKEMYLSPNFAEVMYTELDDAGRRRSHNHPNHDRLLCFKDAVYPKTRTTPRIAARYKELFCETCGASDFHPDVQRENCTFLVFNEALETFNSYCPSSTDGYARVPFGDLAKHSIGDIKFQGRVRLCRHFRYVHIPTGFYLDHPVDVLFTIHDLDAIRAAVSEKFRGFKTMNFY